MLVAIDAASFSLHRSGWARFASTFLLFYGQIIATEFLLGMFSVLWGYSLVALNAAIATVVVLLLRRKFGTNIFARYFAATRKSFATTWRRIRKDPFFLAVLCLLVAFLCWILFLGILFPATDYDGNSYHLTFVGNMIQNHTFYDVPTSLQWLAGYPKAGEFIQAWSALITHRDTFTDVTQLPFLALAIYSLYAIAVRVGADKRQARFAALLFGFLPIVLNQLKTTYVDVMLTSVFFAGLALVIRKRLSRLDLVLVGIVFSLLIGIKSTGFLFVFALLPLLFWNLYKSYGKAYRQYLFPLLLILLPTSFGLYWYIKDLVLYGSPIYPFGVQLGGHTLFPGKNFQDFVNSALQSTSLPHGCVQRIWFVWTEQKDWFGCMYNYDTNYAGLGPIWFIVLIPAILTSVYFAIKKRNGLYAAIAATVLGLFAMYPTNYYSRYTMFITAVGVIALGIVLTNVARLTVRLVKGLVVILVLSVIATNFVLCNFAPSVVASELRSVLAGSARGSVYATIPGRAFIFFENRVKPGEVVTYDSNPYFIYPLWTPDFSDKVLYIRASNENDWYRQMASQHVKYAFTTLASQENKWASDRMKEIYKDDMYEIFQTY